MYIDRTKHIRISDPLTWTYTEYFPEKDKAMTEKDVDQSFTGELVTEAGTTKRYLLGELHCEEGPAVVTKNNNTYYYLNGVCMTKYEWLSERADLKENARLASLLAEDYRHCSFQLADGKKYAYVHQSSLDSLMEGPDLMNQVCRVTYPLSEDFLTGRFHKNRILASPLGTGDVIVKLEWRDPKTKLSWWDELFNSW